MLPPQPLHPRASSSTSAQPPCQPPARRGLSAAGRRRLRRWRYQRTTAAYFCSREVTRLPEATRDEVLAASWRNFNEAPWQRRLSRTALMALAAVAVHAGLLALGLGVSWLVDDAMSDSDASKQRVAVEMEAKEQAPPAEARPQPIPPPAAPKPRQAKPPPVLNRTTPPDKTAPPVAPVVGIAHAATAAAGSGPTLAVGNTRMGEGPKEAADPAQVRDLTGSDTNGQLEGLYGVSAAPVRQRAVQPKYPEALRRRGIEASVVLSLLIGTDGRVQQATVLQGAGYTEFDEAAVRAARLESYRPALQAGKAVAHTIRVRYTFRLTD